MVAIIIINSGNMEQNVLATDDFDSVATAVYRAIDDSPSQRMDFEPANPILEPEDDEVNEDDEDAYEEDEISHEMDECSKSSIAHEGYHNISLEEHHSNDDENDGEDEDDAGAETEGEAEVQADVVSDTKKHNITLPSIPQDEDDDGLDAESLEPLRYEEDVQSDQNDHTQQSTPVDPMIFHDDSGMIKKITLTNPKSTLTTENVESFNSKVIKVKTPSPVAQALDEKNTKQQQRSSTPFSREYIALQKSVNDSKVLTGFVADTSEVKTRKLRKKKIIVRSIIPTTPTTSDHSYSSKKWRDNANKRKQHNKHYVPLKDEAAAKTASPTGITTVAMTDKCANRPSRSRSLYNNYSDNSNSSVNSKHNKRSRSVQKYDSDSSTTFVLNKWPSEDNFTAAGTGGFKRTNMRSENSEFVQKQKEFLQQVINSTQDTPQRISRSRSIGAESVGGNSNQQKITPRSKERLSRRFRGEVEADEDDQPLLQSRTSVASSTIVNEPHVDDASINTSNHSVSAANTSGEVDTNLEQLEMYIKNVWRPPPKVSQNVIDFIFF